jgi:hypothetical protein
MAEYAPYAMIVTPDLIQTKAYAAGIKKTPPGVLLQDILNETGGVYEYEMYLTPEFKGELNEVAKLTGDAELAHIATLTKAPIPLGHLRNVDPHTTRIVLGHKLNYTEEESRALGLRHEGPFDPRNTIYINRSGQ